MYKNNGGEIVKEYLDSKGNTIRINNSYIKGKTMEQCLAEINATSTTHKLYTTAQVEQMKSEGLCG